MRNLIAALGITTALTTALMATGCGGDDEETDTTTSAQATELAEIKTYLTDHTSKLSEQTAELKRLGEEYHALADAAEFDYARLLEDDREAVAQILDDSKRVFRVANPAYEEAEGVVAGVPSLAEFDVIIDAGASGDSPDAVPFDLELPNGKVLKKPGNFFFLTETSLFGTSKEFVAKGVEPDLNGDGEVEFGEALPDAEFYLAATSEFDRYAKQLDQAAQEFEPTESDALTALVVMTPTMSEYFEAWKNSRFIAGEGATEPGFVATSRLSDITDILEGLILVYGEMADRIAEADPAQAQQTQERLEKLRDFAARLRDQEADGKKFTAEEAETLGSEAQRRAEAIAGQISQAAAKLGIELQDA